MATSQWEEAKLTPSAYHSEGRGGLWVGMVLEKVGQVLAVFWGVGRGGAAQGWVGDGDSVGKGLYASTSSIPCLPKSTPALLAGERWWTSAAHLGPVLGQLLLMQEGPPPPAKVGETGPCPHVHT